MTTKVIVHVDLDDVTRVKRALANIENLLAAVNPREADMVLLANGQAVKFLQTETSVSYADRLQRLVRLGMRVLVCRNSLEHLEIAPERLLDVCQIVPAGIVTLARLQNEEGFGYVKP